MSALSVTAIRNENHKIGVTGRLPRGVCSCRHRFFGRQLGGSAASVGSRPVRLATALLGFLCSDEQLPSGSGRRPRLRTAGIAARGRRGSERTQRLPGRQLTRTGHRHVQRLGGGQCRLRTGRQSPTLDVPRHRSQPGTSKLQSGEYFVTFILIGEVFLPEDVGHFSGVMFI